jgi:hypothetical protein
MNHPENDADPRTAKDGDWLTNYYAVLPALPEVRIEEKPVCTKITKME